MMINLIFYKFINMIGKGPNCQQEKKNIPCFTYFFVIITFVSNKCEKRSNNQNMEKIDPLEIV